MAYIGGPRGAHWGYWDQVWISLIFCIFRRPPGVETTCLGGGKCPVPGPYNSITDRRIGGYPRIYIEIS